MAKLVLVVVLLGASAVLAQNNSQSDQKEIVSLEQQLTQMDKTGVYPQQFVNEHVASDLVWENPGGAAGRDEFTKSFPDQQILEEKNEDVKVRTFGNTAVSSGKWWKKAKITSENGKVEEFDGYFQNVWVKQNGKWQLVASATSPLYHPKKEQGAK